MYFGHVFNDCMVRVFLSVIYIYHSLILSYYHRLILLYCLICNPVVISALFWVWTQFLQFLLSPRTFLSGFPQAVYYCPLFIPFSFCGVIMISAVLTQSGDHSVRVSPSCKLSCLLHLSRDIMISAVLTQSGDLSVRVSPSCLLSCLHHRSGQTLFGLDW